MGDKGQKVYCRICKNHHAQFAGGFKLPVGAVYGRIGDTYFVSTYRVEKDGKVGICLKEKDAEWRHAKIPIASEIYQMVLDCIEQEGAPVIESYNVPREKERARKKPENPAKTTKKTEQNDGETMIIDGKKYRVLPTEWPLMEGLPQSQQYDGVNMRPQFTQYGVHVAGVRFVFFSYEDAEKFCKEHKISENKIMQEFYHGDSGCQIRNEPAYLATDEDRNRHSEITEIYG